MHHVESNSDPVGNMSAHGWQEI